MSRRNLQAIIPATIGEYTKTRHQHAPDGFDHAFQVDGELLCNNLQAAQQAFNQLVEVVTDSNYFEDTHPDLEFTPVDDANSRLIFAEGVKYKARHKVLEPSDCSTFLVKLCELQKQDLQFYMIIEQETAGSKGLFAKFQRVYTIFIADNNVKMSETVNYKFKSMMTRLPVKIPESIIAQSLHRELRLVVNPNAFVVERNIRTGVAELTPEEKQDHSFGVKVQHTLPGTPADNVARFTTQFNKLHPRIEDSKTEEKAEALQQGDTRTINLLFPTIDKVMVEVESLSDTEIKIKSQKGSGVLNKFSLWYQFAESVSDSQKTDMTLVAAFTLAFGTNSILKWLTTVTIDDKAESKAEGAQANILEFFATKMLVTIMRKAHDMAERSHDQTDLTEQTAALAI